MPGPPERKPAESRLLDIIFSSVDRGNQH
jgi:hypothetical protein